MSRVPRWGYGSKRRIHLIRWNPYQIAGLIVLAFSLMAFGFVLARLLASLAMDQRQEQEDSLFQSGANVLTTSKSVWTPNSGSCRLVRHRIYQTVSPRGLN